MGRVEELRRFCSRVSSFLLQTRIINEEDRNEIVSLVSKIPIDAGASLNTMLYATPSLFREYAYWKSFIFRLSAKANAEYDRTRSVASAHARQRLTKLYGRSTEAGVRDEVQNDPALVPFRENKEAAESLIELFDGIGRSLIDRERMLEQISNNDREEFRGEREGRFRQ